MSDVPPFRRIFRALFLSLCLLVIWSVSADAALPNVLYPKDIDTYKRIFELQEKGRFTDADKLIKNINNDILMGYVLHQRFMSPWHKTTFVEARDWLRKYSDHPFANDVYKLGLARGARAELKRPLKEAKRTQY